MTLVLRRFILSHNGILGRLEMPRKRSAVQNGSISTSVSTKEAILPIPSPPPSKPPKRQSSARTLSGIKRKASNPASMPPLKRATSSAILEATEDRGASPDEGESRNPELDEGDQATQKRQPAVKSDILPLPWKGRLGFAYSPLKIVI